MGENTEMFNIVKKGKEWRDWLTFWASLVAVFGFPALGYVIHVTTVNERLEANRRNDETYVQKAPYEKNATLMWSKIESTNEKIDGININVIHLQDAVQSLERTLINNQTPKR